MNKFIKESLIFFIGAMSCNMLIEYYYSRSQNIDFQFLAYWEIAFYILIAILYGFWRSRKAGKNDEPSST